MLDPIIKTIPWAYVQKEFDWLPVHQGEGYTRTYLLNHPEVIEEGLKLVGVEAAIPAGKETLPNGTPKQVLLADVVFAKDNRYYVVETEESSTKRSVGLDEAKERAAALEEILAESGDTDAEVVPVFVGIEFSKEDKYGYKVGMKRQSRSV